MKETCVILRSAVHVLQCTILHAMYGCSRQARDAVCSYNMCVRYPDSYSGQRKQLS
eukprot:jgi/Botrbrau1/6860/Bobra.152_2s0019.1